MMLVNIATPMSSETAARTRYLCLIIRILLQFEWSGRKAIAQVGLGQYEFAVASGLAAHVSVKRCITC